MAMEKKSEDRVSKVLNKLPMVLYVTILLLILHMVAFELMTQIETPLKKLVVHNSFGFSGMSGFELSIATFAMIVMEAFVTSIVGAVLVARYGWWNIKLFSRIVLYYLVYLAVSLGIIVYEGNRWGISGNDYLILFAIENSLLPLLVIGMMAAVVGLIRLLKRYLLKKNNEDNDLSLT